MNMFKTMTHHHRAFPRWVATLLMLSGLTLSASLQAAALRSLDFQSLTGDSGQLVLTLTESAAAPKVFAIDSPARIAIDLPGVRNALQDNLQNINRGITRRIIAAENNGSTRVVIALSRMVPHKVSVQGEQIIIALNHLGVPVAAAPVAVTPAPAPVAASAPRYQPVPVQPAPVAVAPTAPESVQYQPVPQQSVSAVPAPVAVNAPAPAPAAPQVAGPNVKDIDFRRGKAGEGRLLIRLSSAAIKPRVRTEGTRLIVDIPGATLPTSLAYRYDVLDFGTPVQTINAVQKQEGARLTVIAATAYTRSAQQNGDTFELTLAPVAPPEVTELPYTGAPVSLNFQNIETRAVLEILADAADTNIVVSDAVKGDITLRLKDVPWDQALDIILKTKGLDKREEGNVVYVAPLQELAEREKQALVAQNQNATLASLQNELIQVNYAKAGDLAELLAESDNAIVSERGKVAFDERTNSLLVLETADKLEEIRSLVKTLDVPVSQVLIESRIIIASNDFSRELGVRFGGAGVARQGNNGLVSIGGSAAGNDTVVQSFLSNGFPVSQPSLQDRSIFSAPVVSAAGNPGQLALAVLGSDYLLDLELSALQAEGRGEIVSTPRVTTANQREAVIEQGVEVPFSTSSNQGTNVQFKEAVLQLKVTPQITPDNSIIMDLEVRQDSVGDLVPSGQEGGLLPTIDKRRAETQVLVNNNDTIVLGGIFETTKRNDVSKVPLLGDLPVIGGLFRTKRKQDDKRELLIFVTPKILDDRLVAGQ